MKITYEDIKPYIEKGLISEQSHPEDENVRIFNYTHTCQYEKAWDKITNQCRGLIMNIKTGEILARPFPKFFNYQEHVTNNWPIPDENPIITEKLDGSLGILYTLNGKTRVATRGSFTSDQAVWATNWWKENKGDEPYGNDITYLVEIIYPENRIVVNYDFSGLVHITSLYTETGLVVPDSDKAGLLPIRKVKRVYNKDLKTLLEMDEENSEGFVLFYPNANIRMKIKFPEYVRLHKIVTGLSEIGIWEMLRDGADFTPFLERVPDEFMDWLNKIKNDLEERFNEIESYCETLVHFAKRYHPRKEQARFIMDNDNKEYSGVVFAMLDGKDYKRIIWRSLRPHGHSQFKIDEDL